MQWISKFFIDKNNYLNWLCEKFYNNSNWKSEFERNKLAKTLLNKWELNKNIPTLWYPPFFDYWYLIELYSMNKHINLNGENVKLKFDWQWEAYVEDFKDWNIKSSCLLDKMFEIFTKKWKKFITKKDLDVSRILSREDNDLLLKYWGNETLEFYWFSPDQYKIVNIPIDIYLRLFSNNLFWNKNIFTHVYGYRLRDDFIKSTLFMWYKKYWWPCFIDWFWLNISFESLISRYIIIENSYFI